MELDAITNMVLKDAIRIHRHPGPSLFASVYERLLEKALQGRGLHVERQRAISISHDGITFDEAFRLDLLVERCVILEVKSVERLAPVHTKQLLTCLRLTNLQLGLHLNFGAATMKEGIKRVVNDLAPSDSPGMRVNNAE